MPKQITDEERLSNKSMALYLDELRRYRLESFPRRSLESSAWTRKRVAERINRRGVHASVSTLDRAMQGLATEYAAIVAWAAIVGGSVDHLLQIASADNPNELAKQLAQQRWDEMAVERRQQKIGTTSIAQILDTINDPDIVEIIAAFKRVPKLREQLMAVLRILDQE